MSFSISSLFGGGAPKQNATPAAPTTATPVPANSQVSPGNLPAAPGNLPAPEDAKAVHSPLDQFKTLWEPVENKGSIDTTSPALDPAKLQELVSKADFSSTISRENLAKIAQGGEEAQKAFTDSMNSVAQQVMVQALLATNKMTEQAVSKVNSAWESKLPEMLKKQTLSETLRDANPVYSNPAVKPVIDAVQSQLAAKYPNASTTELREMSNNFIKVMSEAFNPATVDTSKAKESVDWEKFLNGGN